MFAIALAIIRVSLTVAVFCYCAWRDYKTREVENKVWYFAMPLATSLTITELVFFSPSLLISYLLIVAFLSLLGIMLFYFNGFGGADAKALIFLALSLPFYPTRVLSPPFPSIVAQYCFPLAVFLNTLLIPAFIGVGFFTINLIDLYKSGNLFNDMEPLPFHKRLLVLFSARRIALSDLKKKHFWFPLEKLEDDRSQTVLSLLPEFEERDKVIMQLSRAFAETRLTWATPGIPLLTYMLFGLIIALCLGDGFWMLECLLQ